jgi:anti-sigma regulatory factor (Ser/Thr protein kinase)
VWRALGLGGSLGKRSNFMGWRFQAADATEAVGVRHEFLAFLRESCTPDSDYDSALVVFGELVANVVRHAPGPIEIAVQCDATGAVILNVCDSGNGFSPVASLPPSTQLGGRGLYMVSRLGSRLSATRTNGGNQVTVTLPVKAQQAHLHLVHERRAPAAEGDGEEG